MLIHPLAERLRAVGMAAMADAFLEMQSNADAAGLTREDWLGLLLDCEVTARDSKRLGRRLRRDCVRTRWSRTPISAPRAVWTGLCSTNSRVATGSVKASTL
jgi:hypothetical protein